ncbi:hypothetical protein CGLO_03559 [Colletotrichum gloeosporioides Cg-14]|uniref:Uncharacterized protein n=1 Tax=Colletotrichum gloeosporioides (strain Cg-14) TaxID=1237896 RepID=T0KWB3_COLGC|nr:hypothetical protein CGLO_03559 [Colletotrichum gloeosporioides Cg-14]
MKFTILIFAGAAAVFIKCGTPSNDQVSPFPVLTLIINPAEIIRQLTTAFNNSCREDVTTTRQGGCEMWCGKRCPSSNLPVCIPKANKDYDCVCAST